MALIKHPAWATVKHQGIVLTVEMINPNVNLDGRIPRGWRYYTYRIPFGKRGAVVDVVGIITHATFAVTGWRHPIQFRTNNLGIGDPIIIQHIEIGTYGSESGDVGFEDYAEIDLSGLPLTKLRDAAIRASTFTGKLKTRKSNTKKLTEQKITVTSRHPYLRIVELDHEITDIKVGGGLPGKEFAQLSRKSDLENVRAFGPMRSDQALNEIAKHYKNYYKIGKENLGYLSCAKYLEKMTGRSSNTCQQMISICRERGKLPKPTKRKRGTK